MELKDTVEMMQSADYKERFIAEWRQLVIRIGKLRAMLSSWEAGQLNFTPSCPKYLLEAQVKAMEVYEHFLEERARIEGIELFY